MSLIDGFRGSIQCVPRHDYKYICSSRESCSPCPHRQPPVNVAPVLVVVLVTSSSRTKMQPPFPEPVPPNLASYARRMSESPTPPGIPATSTGRLRLPPRRRRPDRPASVLSAHIPPHPRCNARSLVTVGWPGVLGTSFITLSPPSNTSCLAHVPLFVC